jgi:hypothetical protein
MNVSFSRSSFATAKQIRVSAVVCQADILFKIHPHWPVQFALTMSIHSKLSSQICYSITTTQFHDIHAKTIYQFSFSHFRRNCELLNA